MANETKDESVTNVTKRLDGLRKEHKAAVAAHADAEAAQARVKDDFEKSQTAQLKTQRALFEVEKLGREIKQAEHDLVAAKARATSAFNVETKREKVLALKEKIEWAREGKRINDKLAAICAKEGPRARSECLPWCEAAPVEQLIAADLATIAALERELTNAPKPVAQLPKGWRMVEFIKSCPGYQLLLDGRRITVAAYREGERASFPAIVCEKLILNFKAAKMVPA
jgi:hypothetical protein